MNDNPFVNSLNVMCMGIIPIFLQIIDLIQ